MSLSLLPNIVWHALAGPQARFASGSGTARRYTRGFSPIVGFADPGRPGFDALAPWCEVGEHLYVGGWRGACPPGWRIHEDSSAHQMVWEGGVPADDDTLEATPLRAEHVPQMLELVALTQPGPFGERTIELGAYLGVFDGGRLVAMAGERMEAGALREVSGVCTDPASQGRGLARRLMLRLVRAQLDRGQVPFLHVMHDNARAAGLYERMGFRRRGELAVRVVCRTEPGSAREPAHG